MRRPVRLTKRGEWAVTFLFLAAIVAAMTLPWGIA